MPRRAKLSAAVAAAKTAEKKEAGEPTPAAPSGEAPSPRRAGKLDPLAARQDSLEDLAQGRVRDVRLRLVDPKTCRMWDRHNRLYDLLTPENCADLIDSIRAQGRQEIPAVVRRLKGDADHAYEVISGARRHYAVSHLREVEHRRQIQFLIEVRELEDEEAFRFSDLENRSRRDISDYERGREYLAALDAYYDGNLSRMADRMEMSKGTLSSYLSVARLPEIVLRAYGDPRAIAVRHGQALNPILRGEGRERLLRRAELVAKTQDTAIEATGAPVVGGAEVFKMLTKDGASGTRARAEDYGRHQGRPIVKARAKGHKLSLEVDLRADQGAVIDAIRQALGDAV